MLAADWIGRVGETWAAERQRTDRSFAGLEPALTAAIVAAMPGGAARLIDIGCGAGATSLAVAAALPEAHIVGLDLSTDLATVATGRAGECGLADRCRFVSGDAPSLAAAEAPFDGLFSRHGVMFFDDPVAAFRGLAKAASPGTPFVFSCFAAPADNPWATETMPAAGPPPAGDPPPGPFAFADPARVRAILAGSGWTSDVDPRRVAYRYVAGGGADPVSDAVGFFRRIGPAARVLSEAGEADRQALLDRIRADCAARLDGGEVTFPAVAWVWTVQRERAR